MINPETHTCSTCKYTWKHGQDGSHECSYFLLETIKELEAKIAKLKQPLQLSYDPDLFAILGRPNFACAQISALLRLDGKDIPKKAEMEQAFTLLYLLNLWLKYGNEYSKVGDKELAALHEKYIKNG